MLGTVLKRAGGLGLGTAIGQGVVLAATPWLVRVYGPTSFGVLALLITATNVSIAVGCARFDLALLSARDDEAPSLLRLCALVGCVAAFVATIVASLLDISGPAAQIVGQPLLLGTCVVFATGFQAASSQLLRDGNIRAMAALRGGQGILFVGLALASNLGLLWAQALSYAPAALVLAVLLAKGKSGPSIAGVARRYRSFALLGLPGAVLDVVGYSLCIWIVTSAYGASGSGEFSQVQRLVGAPLMLVSISLGQIMLRETAQLRDDPPRLIHLIKRLLLLLGGGSVAALVALALAGEPVLGWLLGAKWHISGTFIVAISAAVFIRACISPVSAILAGFNRLDLALRWQALYFVSAASMFTLASRTLLLESFVIFYAAHEIVLYLIYLGIIMAVFRKT